MIFILYIFLIYFIVYIVYNIILNCIKKKISVGKMAKNLNGTMETKKWRTFWIFLFCNNFIFC